MTSLFRLKSTRPSLLSKVAPLWLILMIASACQTGSPAAPTFPVALISAPPTAAVPTTGPILQTPTTAASSPRGPWLVFRKTKPDELGIVYPDGSGLTTAAAQACKSGPRCPS